MRPIDRREVLKKGALAGAALWAAPQITSMPAALAQAAGSPLQSCPPYCMQPIIPCPCPGGGTGTFWFVNGACQCVGGSQGPFTSCGCADPGPGGEPLLGCQECLAGSGQFFCIYGCTPA
jgi:hypothetical protein